jgi:hypothetical protein
LVEDGDHEEVASKDRQVEDRPSPGLLVPKRLEKAQEMDKTVCRKLEPLHAIHSVEA